jgi:bleomycin hydrolase
MFITNVPLSDFMAALKNAVRRGFYREHRRRCIRTRLDRTTQCAVIPDFDILRHLSMMKPSVQIFKPDNNRRSRHASCRVSGEGRERLVPDKGSGSGSRNNDPAAKEFGYYFFSEDYVKLKMMDFMVHKDAVKDLLSRFK